MQQFNDAATAALALDDPGDALDSFVRTCVSFRSGALGAIAGSIPTTPVMNDAAKEGHLLLEQLVVRAQEAGVVRADVTSIDVHLLIELFSRRRPDDDPAFERVLAVALAGLRVRDGEPLPGEAQTWLAYARRWRHRS